MWNKERCPWGESLSCATIPTIYPGPCIIFPPVAKVEQAVGHVKNLSERPLIATNVLHVDTLSVNLGDQTKWCWLLQDWPCSMLNLLRSQSQSHPAKEFEGHWTCQHLGEQRCLVWNCSGGSRHRTLHWAIMWVNGSHGSYKQCHTITISLCLLNCLNLWVEKVHDLSWAVLNDFMFDLQLSARCWSMPSSTRALSLWSKIQWLLWLES